MTPSAPLAQDTARHAKRDRRVADIPKQDLRCTFGILQDRREHDRRLQGIELKRKGER
jgi:hypothetical protein